MRKHCSLIFFFLRCCGNNLCLSDVYIMKSVNGTFVLINGAFVHIDEAFVYINETFVYRMPIAGVRFMPRLFVFL